MVVTVISAIVFAGVLSAYIFLGRGLVRQGYEEELESRSRTTLYYFTQDVSAAALISSPSVSDMTLTMPPPSNATVEYRIQSASSPQSFDGTLTRTQNPANPNIPATLLTGLGLTGSGPQQSCFNYYDSTTSSSPLPIPPNAAIVKQVQLTYTAMAPVQANGFQPQIRSQIVVVSPRVIMKNKPSLQ